MITWHRRERRASEDPANLLVTGLAFTPLALSTMVAYVERSPLESRGALLSTVIGSGELLVRLVTGGGTDAVQEWGYTNWGDLAEVRAVIDHLTDLYDLGLGGLFHGHPPGASAHYSCTDLQTMRMWTTDEEFNLKAAAFPILRRGDDGRVCDLTCWYLQRDLEAPVRLPWRVASAGESTTASLHDVEDSPLLSKGKMVATCRTACAALDLALAACPILRSGQGADPRGEDNSTLAMDSEGPCVAHLNGAVLRRGGS
jgi:hypothetical protein